MTRISKINHKPIPNVLNITNLRQQIKAIQRTKQNYAIESQAAEVTTAVAIAIGIGSTVAGALIKSGIERLIDWWNKKEVKKEIVDKIATATNSFGKYWDDEFMSKNESERITAVDRLRQQPIEDAQTLVGDVENAIKAIISFGATPDSALEESFIKTIRGFFAALEALYELPQVNLGTNVFYEEFTKYLEEPYKWRFIDEDAKEHMRRILVRNWKVPVHGCTIPEIKAGNKKHRFSMYQTILRTLETPEGNLTSDDPLFLRTPCLDPRVIELRKALVDAYRREVNVKDLHGELYYPEAAMLLRKVLSLSSEISRLGWSEEDIKLHQTLEKNKALLAEFKDWAGEAFPIIPEQVLEVCFKSFTQNQKELHKNLCYLLLARNFPSEIDLNKRLNKVLDLVIHIDQKDPEHRLTTANTEMGLFLFGYLDEVIHRDIKINGKPTVNKNHLTKETLNKVLSICSSVVHDYECFPKPRSYKFFIDPPVDSVPGQALRLYHKLSYCFDANGFDDKHGVRDVILPKAIDLLQGWGKEENGYLISGPPEADKNSFVEAFANQLALRLFQLRRDTVSSKKSGNYYDITIKLPDNNIGTLGAFVNYARLNAPCVVHISEAEKLLVPKRTDEGKSRNPTEQEEDLTSKLASDFIEQLRALKRVVLVISTDMPPSEEVDVSKLNKDGFSDDAVAALMAHVSDTAIRGGRSDCKIFSFHKMRPSVSNEPKVQNEDEIREDYIKRKITMLVKTHIKQVEDKLDFSILAAAAKGLEGRQIQKAIEVFTPFILTQENILEAFSKVRADKKQAIKH